MRRIFHLPHYGDAAWSRHGRFYSSYVNLSGAARLTTQVDGEAVVELDFASMQPGQLYVWQGLEPPRDAYAVPGLDPDLRDIYKKTVLVILNSNGRKQAVGALGQYLRDAKINLNPMRILLGFEEAHAPIAEHFYSGAGDWIMNLDSHIAAGVFRRFVAHARAHPEDAAPVLGVHDSFIVPRRAEARLYDAMVDAYREVMGTHHVPHIKRTEPDGTKSYVTAETYPGRRWA